MINIIDDFRISLLLYQVNILVTVMHIIMFARVLLQTVGMMERLNLPLGFFRTLLVHLALLLQMADLPSPPHKLDETLLSDEEKYNEEDDQRDRVLTPFFELYVLPKLRKIHTFHKNFAQSYKKTCIYANILLIL